jgi:DNA (cytosine-5)-methyltransferase 1
MAKKNSYITVTDQFCGAGGSSIGAKKVLDRVGGEVKLAMNHWKLAIETHNTNFPDTLHDCTDISACDPRRYPSTDILITSPECTNHSLAKGIKIAKKQMDMFNTGEQDASAERSRATMWDVCRFAEYHQYNCIIVENVVDARKWVMFDAWLMAMHALGYNHKCVYLNSMHCHPTPQSRDRMYVVFWKQGNKAPMLDYTPAAWCSKCEKNIAAVQTWKRTGKQFGKYRQQYVYCCGSCTTVVEPYYYAAFNCIDWSHPGTRIGDRPLKKYFDKSGKVLKFKGKSLLPLSPNTMTRVDFGLNKYGHEPFQIQTVNGQEHQHRSRHMFEPSFTHTTLQSQAFVINDQHSTGIDFRVKSALDKLPTLTTEHKFKLVTPFVFKGEHSHGVASGKVRPSTAPLQTQTTTQSMAFAVPFVPIARGKSKAKSSLDAFTTQSQMINHGVVTQPLLVDMNTSGNARPASEVLSTVTTGGAKNGIVTTEAFNSFITQYYNGSHCVSHITEEVGSVTTRDRSGLVTNVVPAIEDCFYRMLKDYEIQLAMAFDASYKVLGTSKDKVKQLGNAVTPPAMEWLVQQCIKSLS